MVQSQTKNTWEEECLVLSKRNVAKLHLLFSHFFYCPRKKNVANICNDFCYEWYYRRLLKFVKTFHFLLKSDNIKDTLHEDYMRLRKHLQWDLKVWKSCRTMVFTNNVHQFNIQYTLFLSREFFVINKGIWSYKSTTWYENYGLRPEYEPRMLFLSYEVIIKILPMS